MKNFEELVYTYRHRKVVLYLADLYFNNEELLEQLNDHDMDKMYLLLFFEKKKISEFHSKMTTHHDNQIPKTKLDYIEMILDWESARYTKEDKPLNAYDTLIKFYPHLKNEILPILKEMKLDYSTLEKDKRVVEYVNSLGKTKITDIRKELVDYIKYKTKVNKNTRKI